MPDAAPVGEGLRFAFDRTPWRDVISWLAESADLALHIGELPTGTFTYSDQNPFTPAEALERINLFLQPEGFTLVRSGKLLSLIDLTDPQSIQRLDSLAKLVSVEQLGELHEHDVVKCIFKLGDLDAADAVEELAPLNLMTTPREFTRTNQLMVTDTVGRLRTVKQVLEAFKPGTLDNGTVVKNFSLSHVDAEDVLIVARPHLGLATGEMIGIDVSLSADLPGKNIFVTGVEDKVKLIENLIKSLDQPTHSVRGAGVDAELRSHIVDGGNVETVYNVLQTLLAGEEVRLSMDEEAGSIVALATPAIQVEIEQTVKQLQASGAEFEVIPLKSVDPYFAVSLIEEMLELTEPIVSSSSKSSKDRDSNKDSDRPKIDADPAGMRLFVRAKRSQIEQIKEIIDGLEEGETGLALNNNDAIRLYPLRGRAAEEAMRTAARLWRSDNPIFYYSAATPEGDVAERVVASDSSVSAVTAALFSRSETVGDSAVLLTGNAESQAAVIRCHMTPRGLLLQSDDGKALDQLEALLRTIHGPTDFASSPPVVFYLKYTSAQDAIRMLGELLDGGEAAREREAGSLVNAYVSSSNGFLGSLVTSRDGTTTMMSGAITVVADSRLNRLIAQGTDSDITRIESYLKIIDKDTSITTIHTHGTSHVIELTYAKAEEVAEAVREAYVGRVATDSKSGAAAAKQPGKPGDQNLPDRSRDDDLKKSSSSQKLDPRLAFTPPAPSMEPKMTIAVHEASNSLIVTAPEQLFLEVEQLAKKIDLRSQQSVRVIQLPGGAAYDSLKEIFGGRPSSTVQRAKN